MTENQKPIPIALAEWTDWFCRNVKDPQDFRWIHMADMADQLRSLYKQLDSQQHVLDNRLNQVIELETERDELLGALKGVLPFMATETTNCHGDKCRERWCSSCFAEEDAEIAAEMGRTALMAARNALAKVGGAA